MPGGAGEAWRLLSVEDYERGRTAIPGYDGRGNIVTWTSGATGELIGTADYGPYGELFDIWWATDADEASYKHFGFGTEYRDETGLIYYGARYYSPSLGRFISRDPSGEAGSGVNLYAFCGGDPVNSRELYGLCDILSWNSSTSYFSGAGAGSRDFYVGGVFGNGDDQYSRSSPGISSPIMSAGNSRDDCGYGVMPPCEVNAPAIDPTDSMMGYQKDRLLAESQSDLDQFADESSIMFNLSVEYDLISDLGSKRPEEFLDIDIVRMRHVITGGSSLGDYLRKYLPLFGGMLGDVADIGSGVINISINLLTCGTYGSSKDGIHEILGGVGGLLQIGISDVLAFELGILGKAFVTLGDVGNVLTFGSFRPFDKSGIDSHGNPCDKPKATGPWGAVTQFLHDLPIPCYGIYLGPNWGTTQWGPFLQTNWVFNQADFFSGVHDNWLKDRFWVENQLSPTPYGVVPNGPIADAIVLIGIGPFWINNGPH